jgi:hypothetical protein
MSGSSHQLLSFATCHLSLIPSVFSDADEIELMIAGLSR